MLRALGRSRSPEIELAASLQSSLLPGLRPEHCVGMWTLLGQSWTATRGVFWGTKAGGDGRASKTHKPGVRGTRARGLLGTWAPWTGERVRVSWNPTCSCYRSLNSQLRSEATDLEEPGQAAGRSGVDPQDLPGGTLGESAFVFLCSFFVPLLHREYVCFPLCSLNGSSKLGDPNAAPLFCF